MSYSVYAYLTDANKVASIYGSKNQKIFDELSASMKNDWENLDNYFSDKLNPQKNILAVLNDIINSNIRFSDIPFMYGYVYEKICEYYGNLIYNTENLWELEEQSAFIPIPFSTGFPHIISIRKTHLKDKKKKFLSLKEGEGIGDYDYEQEIDDLTYILDEAIEKSKDLIICVY
ncbi:hypothetical protein AGMMS50239_23110 [Bacteroidia bacterium]|nr:hypothetical protein AGMMS50239_23110 [Bacteroidia bacterium]